MIIRFERAQIGRRGGRLLLLAAGGSADIIPAMTTTAGRFSEGAPKARPAQPLKYRRWSQESRHAFRSGGSSVRSVPLVATRSSGDSGAKLPEQIEVGLDLDLYHDRSDPKLMSRRPSRETRMFPKEVIR